MTTPFIPTNVWTPDIPQRATPLLDAHSATWIDLLASTNRGASSELDAVHSQLDGLASLLPTASAAQIQLLLRLRPDIVSPSTLSQVTVRAYDKAVERDIVQRLAALRKALFVRVGEILSEQDVGLSPLLADMELANIRRVLSRLMQPLQVALAFENQAMRDLLRPARERIARLSPVSGNADEAILLEWLASNPPALLIEDIVEAIPALTPAIVAAVVSKCPALPPMRLIRHIPPSTDDVVLEAAPPEAPMQSPPEVGLFHVVRATAPAAPAEPSQAERREEAMSRANSFPFLKRDCVASEHEDLAVPQSCRSDIEAAVLIDAMTTWPAVPVPRSDGPGRFAALQGWLNTKDNRLEDAVSHLLETQASPIGPELTLRLTALLNRLHPTTTNPLFPPTAAAHDIVMGAKSALVRSIASGWERLPRETRTALAWALPVSPEYGNLVEASWDCVADVTLPEEARAAALDKLLPRSAVVVLKRLTPLRAAGQWPAACADMLADRLGQAVEAIRRSQIPVTPSSTHFQFWCEFFEQAEVPREILIKCATSMSEFKRIEYWLSLSSNPTAVAIPEVYAMLRRSRNYAVLCNLLTVAPTGGDFETIMSRVISLGVEAVQHLVALLEANPNLVSKTDRRLFSLMLQVDNRDLRLRLVGLIPGAAVPVEKSLPKGAVAVRKRATR